jgi:uncharacterized protein (DUF2126 family)
MWRDFTSRLAERLGLPRTMALTVFEDVPLLKDEISLPENLDPLKADLSVPGERSRLARLLLAGLDEPAGFVLPLKAAAPHTDRIGSLWESSPWPLRRERLYAVAGDSPLGLRLPLSSLPNVLPAEREVEHPIDPFAPRDAIPTSETLQRATGTVRGGKPREVVKTALAVQVRNGHLYVFMPPLQRIEDSAALLAAIEDTARAIGAPVAIEGYTPPRDPRVRVLNVTPDPGVIEVNIHPAASWHELMATMSTLYEEARQTRLGTEKFMLDGRHTGTGGGNHVTLGGATPVDSPLLRRPDLLRSLVTYWRITRRCRTCFPAHSSDRPAGPRVDEARDDRLYELEIALAVVAQARSGQD